jgi:hypothetical protein
MRFEKVIDLIKDERDYQDSMYDGVQLEDEPTFDSLNTIGHWIIYIESYLNRAKTKFFRSGIKSGLIEKDDYILDPQKCHDIHEDEVLKDLVKVAALAIAALEYRGGGLE